MYLMFHPSASKRHDFLKIYRCCFWHGNRYLISDNYSRRCELGLEACSVATIAKYTIYHEKKSFNSR
jgi:hypothetical protein